MMNHRWIEEHVDAFIADNREALIRDLKTVIDIDSVEAPAEPNAPMARACARHWMPLWRLPGTWGSKPENAMDIWVMPM